MSRDEELLVELRRIAGSVDPVPPDVVRSAQESLTWRTIDAELAELAYDSLLEAQPVGVRGGGTSRLLTFEADGLTVDVQVTEAGGRRRLLGQLAPPGRAVIDVRHPGGQVTVEADDLGRFRVADVPAGPVSLHCRNRAGGGGAVDTDWVTI